MHPGSIRPLAGKDIHCLHGRFHPTCDCPLVTCLLSYCHSLRLRERVTSLLSPHTKGHPLARKILLADDSVTAQNMGRRILADAGYEVITVNNGSAALKKIAEHKPDLVVLDVYMPGYSGLEVCQRIKDTRETARVPVLLTVGKLEPFKPEEARRARADAFIVKPFEASELLTALTKLEDKIVPQPSGKSGQFAKAWSELEQGSGASAKSEKFGDAETGWKNRLIIPVPGSKQEEPEPEEVSTKASKGKKDKAKDKEEIKTLEVKAQIEAVCAVGVPAA